jgi:hypothetical protein
VSAAFDRIFIAAIGACLKKHPPIYQKLMNEFIKRAVFVRAQRPCVPLHRREIILIPN